MGSVELSEPSLSRSATGAGTVGLSRCQRLPNSLPRCLTA